MALYRPQAGGFAESMRQAVEVDASTLLDVIRKQLGILIEPSQVRLAYCCVDPRNGWLTHVVTVEGCAVGFINELLSITEVEAHE